MVDFHSHFLPGMDDGAAAPEESIRMLEESARQGVEIIFATPHFYADEESPDSFLERREAACRKLLVSLAERDLAQIQIPEIFLGAEIYYFPGIATCDEIIPLALENTGLLLVEPPFIPFSNSMLDEVESIRKNLGLDPVIAHLDRYCRMFRDNTLFEKLAERDILVQVNASFFLHPDSSELALKMLEREMFQMLGSDCHNLTGRAPNMGFAAEIIKRKKLDKHLAKVNDLSYNMCKLF